MSETNQKTCAERIADQRDGRLKAISDLAKLANAYDVETALSALAMVGESVRNEALDEFDALKLARHEDYGADDYANPDADREAEDMAEWARERIYEYPLGVSTRTVIRIDLSTGGPADWLEVVCDQCPVNGYEVERIVYHFADWWDHAEVELEGDEFTTAEEFARNVAPELCQ